MTEKIDISAPMTIRAHLDASNDLTVPLDCSHIIPHCLGEEAKSEIEVQAI
jgi:hypothetical protein